MTATLKIGLRATFDDPGMNAELEQLRWQRQENRGRGKAVTGRWAQEKEKTAEKQKEQEFELRRHNRKKSHLGIMRGDAV